MNVTLIEKVLFCLFQAHFIESLMALMPIFLIVELCLINLHWSLALLIKIFSWKTFYAPEIEDWGAYCFCPVCHSVILSKTLTLLITFEQWVLELWYFTWVSSHIYHYFLPCDLDLGVWLKKMKLTLVLSSNNKY